MNPPLPLLSSPAPTPAEYKFGKDHPAIEVKDLDKARVQSEALLKHSQGLTDDQDDNDQRMFF